jgi:peptidyl-tRNA hydrolase
MIERRMDAYYYSFDSTGVEVVDKILGAVACAGKAYHHTDDWMEETNPYDDHTGETPVEWIQNAAKEAAVRIEHLQKLLEMRDVFIVKHGLWHEFVNSLELKNG